MYVRNQLFSLSFLFACVQILDFLSFHHLFGPWAIIIGNLMKVCIVHAILFNVLAFFGHLQMVTSIVINYYSTFNMELVLKLEIQNVNKALAS